MASGVGHITARTLTVTAIGVNKTYDGTANATVTLSDNKVSGDAVTDAYTSARFAPDGTVGTGKTVNVSGISISGTDAGNYSLSSTTATTSANIDKKPTARSMTARRTPRRICRMIASRATCLRIATAARCLTIRTWALPSR